MSFADDGPLGKDEWMLTSMRRLTKNRWLLSLIVALGMAGMATAMAPTAQAEEPPPTRQAPDALRGAPEIRPDAPAGYYIWRDDDGINLRTHGPREAHHFRAALYTDGVFVDVKPIAGELGDKVRVARNGHALILDVHTYDATDGVNFRVRGGTRLTFRLELEDRLIATDQIFLGSIRSHPDTNPFTVRLPAGHTNAARPTPRLRPQ